MNGATERVHDADHRALVHAVQTNCHIADARHATDLSLCIYLLQMREFYRWEQGLAFGAPLERTAVGPWLAQREALWAELEERPFETLPLGGVGVNPFDADAVNTALASTDLVYGAGLAGTDRPTFFLAQRHSAHQRDGVSLLMCGRELARGLAAPPAALVGEQAIVLRRESLARWLWEKYEAFSLRRADGPFKALLDGYRVSDGDMFVAALPRLVDELSETLVLHELGEHRAGQWLGPGWAAMRLDIAERRTDLFVRAVRDHVADLEVTLPTLLDRGATHALHFWFATYDGVRESLFPALPDAYAAWAGGDAGCALRSATRLGAQHFRALAQQTLELHARHGSAAGPEIARLLSGPRAICRCNA